MRVRPVILLAFAPFSLVAAVACSSSSSSPPPPCNTNPFECAKGTTCAVKDSKGNFDCLPSGSGTAGSACTNVAGSTTCGDGLICLQLTAAGGQCSPFCSPTDATHGCSGGAMCQEAALQSTVETFYVCTGGTTSGGGTDAGKD
jgi:hypothetical protein